MEEAERTRTLNVGRNTWFEFKLEDIKILLKGAMVRRYGKTLFDRGWGAVCVCVCVCVFWGGGGGVLVTGLWEKPVMDLFVVEIVGKKVVL